MFILSLFLNSPSKTAYFQDFKGLSRQLVMQKQYSSLYDNYRNILQKSQDKKREFLIFF